MGITTGRKSILIIECKNLNTFATRSYTLFILLHMNHSYSLTYKIPYMIYVQLFNSLNLFYKQLAVTVMLYKASCEWPSKPIYSI